MKRANKTTTDNFKEKGQVSIFLSICMVLIFTLIAFVVNVGLFVKAKINLQNAVDAAAWSGAAVQARRLTNIAHLNWEMRNTYKEWMFKYYVLGQNANSKTQVSSGSAPNKMDFRLKPFDAANPKTDKFNVPSICVHFGSSHNVCNVYSVPGLPRFEVAGLPNVAEQFDAAIDTLVEQKAKNCVMRGIYNFMAASSYAYSTGESVSGNDVPVVLGNRVGAWIQSIELSLRMRNLEYIVNQRPIADVCSSGCSNPISDLSADVPAMIERTSKAFFAAYKNLGGGKFKNESSITGSFRLTELSPNSSNISQSSLSNLFIPPDKTVATAKTYLNLIPMVFNYVTFFTTFSPNAAESITNYGIADNTGTSAEGGCSSSKTALPVPGYVMGFYKDPSIMTYYGVKGSARYVGLLNPFTTGSDGIELNAYAAAKPFGGRIGPRLVDPKGASSRDSQANSPRNGPDNSQRTRDFILGFEPSTTFDAGNPIPPEDTSNPFYISGTSNDENIGGIPENDGADVRFGIPNLIYTLPNSGTKLTGGDGTFIRKLKAYPNVSTPIVEGIGLFDGEQFAAFRDALNVAGAGNGASFADTAQLNESIALARKPTNYDAANYLIPTLRGHDKDAELESPPTLTYLSGGSDRVALFAPLYGSSLLYSSRSSVETIIKDYLSATGKPVEKYLDALKKTAEAYIAADPKYEKAAKGIYDPSETLDSSATEIVNNPLDCRTASIASKFNFLFRSQVGSASPKTCGILPISESVTQYIVKKGEEGNAALFYYTTYRPNPDLDNLQISTAYAPGLIQGATSTGDMDSPFQNIQNAVQNRSHKRNYYSTKLIPIRNVISGIGADELQENLMSEFEESADKMVNFLQETELNEFTSPGNSIPGVTDQGLEY